MIYNRQDKKGFYRLLRTRTDNKRIEWAIIEYQDGITKEILKEELKEVGK